MCAVLMQTYSVRELSSKRLLQCNHASDFWKCVVETKPSFGSVACLHEAQTWKSIVDEKHHEEAWGSQCNFIFSDH